jgi:hypothetical protein
MLGITGGDNTAVDEISEAQDAILALPEPDLLIMARLAIHRDSLAGRNNNMGFPSCRDCNFKGVTSETEETPDD